MVNQASDPFSGLLVLALVLVVLWVIAYSAARVALGGGELPSFAGRVVEDPDHVHVSVAAIGLAAAFRVGVRWEDDPRGEVLATAEFVGPLAPLEWDMAIPAAPDESRQSRTLRIEWRTGTEPTANYRVSRAPVLVPSRLLAPTTDTPGLPSEPDI